MKKLLLISCLIILITSCNSSNKSQKKNVFEDIYKFKGPVKEIQQKIINANFYYFSITTFDRNGTPIETIEYDKKGNAKNIEPWTKLTEDELKELKIKKEYDNQKRLIKQIEYNSHGGSIQTEYQYSKNSKKTKEIKTFEGRNIQSFYDSNELLKEVRLYAVADNELYQQSKEKYIYNKKKMLIEKQDYRYDESEISAKHLYEYDNIGSLIKTTTYYSDSKIPEIDKREITYY